MSETLLAFAFFLGFQTASSRAPAANRPDLCTVEGTIIAADTGQPLRKAWVFLSKAEGRGDTQGAATDASGHFIIKNVEPGRYTLSVTRPGCVPQNFGEHGGRDRGTILTLSAGQQVRDISMRLIRAAAISGHVYDEDGDPIQGAIVSALRYAYERGRRQLTADGGTQTDDRGEYRIFALEPGSYFISAVYSQRQYGAIGGGPGYAPTYYPSAMDPSEATPVSVQGGDDFPGVDLNLQPVRTVTVSGRAFNAINGRPGV